MENEVQGEMNIVEGDELVVLPNFAEKTSKIIESKGLLDKIGKFLKPTLQQLANIPQEIIDKFGRALTIIQKPQDSTQINISLPNDPMPNDPIPDGSLATIPLAIKIRRYIFKLISKCVLFDRRFVNFNVYRMVNEGEAELPTDIVINDIRWKLIHELTAYASSSQVGSWRLCKNEAGNRLNKFDDYVQSTVIQWKLARFICYWFYRYQLPWDNEPEVHEGDVLNPEQPGLTQAQADQMNAPIIRRNRIRNNLFGIPQTPNECHTWDPTPRPNLQQPRGRISPPSDCYNHHTIPDPPLIPREAAIPYVYVMEGNIYQYLTLPMDYTARTQPDNNISDKIIGRGLGSTDKLRAPCPFNYWKTKGKCGDKDEENYILEELSGFSDALDGFYNIESNIPYAPPRPNENSPYINPPEPPPNTYMKITELYRDCMVYKNFKQEATVFKVRLIPKDNNNLCVPPNNTPIPLNPIPANPINFYKQSVDIVFVNFHIKQYTSFLTACLPPCYDPDPQPKQNQNPTKKSASGFITKKIQFDLARPEFNVQGYYVLTIIPTWVLKILNYFPITYNVTPCNFDVTTEIGLFEYYIKAGYYACKPLDYTGQCLLRTFPINPRDRVIPQTINIEYAYIGHRLNGQEPFKRLFDFTDAEIGALSTYSEQIIVSPTTVGKLVRALTKARDDALNKTQIEQVNSDCSENYDDENENEDNHSKMIKTQGGKLRKTNKNKKRHNSKLQTNKIKGKMNRKRITKKNRNKRKTKKRYRKI